MGRKDYRHRESKKPKKETKKVAAVNILQPSVPVEVIKKGKKKREEVEGEEG
ncbi:MAG: hypothetical protein GTO24_16350 [candidate division Zixibacteria bacterium]|nr:hypothetical protein [candidate division Zixibacteria bacterium]